MDLGYWLYMNEAEGTGLVNTREGKINAIGRELREAGYAHNVVPLGVFTTLCEKYKIYDITDKEIQKIERKWLS